MIRHELYMNVQYFRHEAEDLRHAIPKITFRFESGFIPRSASLFASELPEVTNELVVLERPIFSRFELPNDSTYEVTSTISQQKFKVTVLSQCMIVGKRGEVIIEI